MSYLVLARKYRPQTFADVVGQTPVVKTLQNSLARQRVAHAILFSGVRGVGKTTLARIMAKAINCESDNQSKPCNTCRSCKEITSGQSLDLHEIDGASNRGIQEIRELKEKIRFLPTSSRYKIIIIDEVHMLTTEAFNALLKTLEEPPDHIYFMFATTELHKIPITILSRCQRYELKRITNAELTAHFTMICKQEGVTIDPDALTMIVKEAEGSVRDGLSLLDQMFAFGDTTITHDDIIQVLGLTDRTILMRITQALLAEDRAGALKTLEGAFEYGIDIKRFTADILDIFRTLVLIKVGDCNELIDLPEDEHTSFQEIADQYTFETLHLKLNLLMEATEELRYTTQPRLALETAFLKIIEAGNVVPVTQLLGKIDSLIQDITPDSDPSSPPASPKKKIEADEPLATPQPPPLQAVDDQQATSKVEEEPPLPTEELSPEAILDDAVPPPVGEKAVKKESVDAEPVDEIEINPHTHDVRRDWLEFTDYVKERKVWMAQDLQLADAAKEVDGELHLHYNDPTTCTLLKNKDNRKLLTEFVLDYFQKDLTVRFITPETNGNGANDEDPESPHKKRQKLSRDPLVQMAVEIFSGHVGDIRIGPRSR